MKKILFGLICSSIFAISIQSAACIHFPNSFRGALVEGKRQVFLFHDGKNAHMVVGTSFDAKKFPSEVAWVLPLPSLPSHYEEIKGPIFEELEQIAPEKYPKLKGQLEGSFGSARQGGIKVHQLVSFEQYQIQPIEILSDRNSDDFNEWLKKNNFNPMPADLQKQYLKKGAVFLAIRMKLNKPGSGTLKARPLHIVYASQDLSFPLKFTHENRKFDLDLFVFSKHEMKVEFTKQYLELVSAKAFSGSSGLFPFVDAIVGKQQGFISRYEGEGLNSESQKIKDIPADPAFSLAALTK